jgi:hypothetical protein
VTSNKAKKIKDEATADTLTSLDDTDASPTPPSTASKPDDHDDDDDDGSDDDDDEDASEILSAPVDYKHDDPEKMRALLAQFTDEQQNRYENFRRSGLQRSTVKKVQSCCSTARWWLRTWLDDTD